jgi:hypothetical protein
VRRIINQRRNTVTELNRPTTVPADPTDRRDPPQFLYGLGSALAIASKAAGVPQLPLPPRPQSPSERRIQVRQALAELSQEMHTMLSRKQLHPGVPLATLGRRLVSNLETVDTAYKTYTPGPGLNALVVALLAEANEEKR